MFHPSPLAGAPGASWSRPRWQVCYQEPWALQGGAGREEWEARRAAVWSALPPKLPSPRARLPCAREAHVSGGLGVGHTMQAHSGSLLTPVKNLPAMQETWVQSLGQEDPLEKEMATHSSVLAWRIPRSEEPSRLQSMDSQELGMT